MKILIPLDGSRFAEEALGPASELAACSGAEVHLVEVVKYSRVHPTWVTLPPTERALMDEYGLPEGEPTWWTEGRPHMGMPAETGGQALERAEYVAEEYLNNVARHFFPRGARKEVIIGEDPAEEIVKYALHEKADLIAMATHGRTGLARLVMGSVARKVLNSRAAPVMLVRPDKLRHDDQEPVAASHAHAEERDLDEHRAT